MLMRKRHVKQFEIALRAIGVGVTIPQAEKIMLLAKVYNKKGGKTSITDTTKINSKVSKKYRVRAIPVVIAEQITPKGGDKQSGKPENEGS